jgi:(p)ppGpp synthase/HD superfamily hydrolase
VQLAGSRRTIWSAWPANTAEQVEDLYASLGYGKFSARQVLQKSAPEQVPRKNPRRRPVVEPARAGARQKDDDPSSRSTAWTT